MSATHGQWMGVQNTKAGSDGVGMFILHAIHMHTGKILVWSGHVEGSHYPAESFEWDPIADPDMVHASLVGFPSHSGHTVDIFCCHQTNLEDGRVMTVGGSQADPNHGHGIRDICMYDPITHTWSRIGEMSVGRWYPTLVTLADSSVLAFSGRDDSGNHLAASVEHFRLPITGFPYTPQVLSGANKSLASYPGLHLVKGGKIAFTGTTWRYELEQSSPINTFNFTKSGSSGLWTDLGIAPGVNNREEGMSILLPPAQDGKILLVGGGWWSDHTSQTAGHNAGTNLNSAAILDTQSSPISWRTLSDMHHPRMNPNVVLLADGTVLVHGGHNTYKWHDAQIPSNVAEIYDPVLDTWTEVAAMGARRQYHSASLLLQDGSVVTMGGVDPTPPGDASNNQRTYEFYRPTYFFKGTRPTIVNVTSAHAPENKLPYGGFITITGTSDTTPFKVALTRLCAMTHHTDSEQRYILLDMAVTAYNSVTKNYTLQVGVINNATVAPPGHYLLWVIDDQQRPCSMGRIVQLSRRQCQVVTDRSHFAFDEVSASGTTDFADSFYVIMEGFTPEELGIPSLTPSPGEITAAAPATIFNRVTDGTVAPGMSGVPNAILFEAGMGVSQRIAFRYTMRFTNRDVFSSGDMPVEDQQVRTNTSKNGYTCSGTLRLTRQNRPFLLDGDPHWLSIDVRVFALEQNQSQFGHNVGDSAADSISFINNVLNTLNADHVNGHMQFEAISFNQADSPVYLTEFKPGTSDRVYNFAIAQVRYRGQTLPANNARMFFRLFRSLSTGVDFNGSTTYRTHVKMDGSRIPALGIHGGQVITIPFYATARVNTAVQSLEAQADPANVRAVIDPIAAPNERYTFFGCWLDINQPQLRFPLETGNPIGPFATGLKAIPELLRGAHCCMVAELDFGTNWLQTGDSPASNDSLSQRNLAVVGSDNPGSPDTHTVQHTFEIKASEAMGIDVPLNHFKDFEVVQTGIAAHSQSTVRLLRRVPDQLMIEWRNLPPGTEATIFMPGISADEVANLHGRIPGPENLSVADANTIKLAVGEDRVTYVPLPSSRYATIAALFSIMLPDTVRYKQQFRITVRQIDGGKNSILGSCDWIIPVLQAEALLVIEQSRLALFRKIDMAIPANDQWKPVFGRYINHIGDKVRGLGGDPDIIEPSLQGYIPNRGVDTKGGGNSRWQCCWLNFAFYVFLTLLIMTIGWLLIPSPQRYIVLVLAAFTIFILIIKVLRCDCKDQQRMPTKG